MSRELGNEALGRESYEEAIEIYSAALLNASKDEQSKLFSNRSLS